MRELFGQGHVVPVVGAGPAVLLGVGETQQSQVAGLLEQLVRREDSGFFPFVDVGVDFLVDEAADRLAKELMGFGEPGAGNHGLGTRFEQLCGHIANSPLRRTTNTV